MIILAGYTPTRTPQINDLALLSWYFMLAFRAWCWGNERYGNEAAARDFIRPGDTGGKNRPRPKCRQVLLNVPPPRQLRRPQAEFRDIAKMLAEVGKIGSNVNQIARKLNSGESPERTAITDAARAVISIRDRLLSAMGRQP